MTSPRPQAKRRRWHLCDPAYPAAVGSRGLWCSAPPGPRTSRSCRPRPSCLPAPGRTRGGRGGPRSPPHGPPAVLISDAEGVRAFGPAPGVMDDITLDTIAYDSAGEVSLSGRAAPDTAAPAARVYVDNAPLLDAPIAADGTWRADLAHGGRGQPHPARRSDRPRRHRHLALRNPVPAQILRHWHTRPRRPSSGRQPGATLWRIARDIWRRHPLRPRVRRPTAPRSATPT